MNRRYSPDKFFDAPSEVGIAKLRPMAALTPDEVASTLVARVMREIQLFSVSATIYEDASAEQVWSHFLDHLVRRELEDQP